MRWSVALLLATGDGEDDPPPAEAVTPGERRVQDGDRVAVHYVGTLDDGTQFDSSAGRDAFEFVVGTGQVIAGFDAAVRGLAVGESRSVRIEPAEAYGEHHPERVVEVPVDQLPAGFEVGTPFQFQGGIITVTEISGETATVDTNHPLAGKALTFRVELVSIG